MKISKSPQNVLILFLSVFLILSSIFIVRLEIKAANLQSQWEKHQQSLKKNEDVLEQLNVFSRYVKKNAIKVDDQNVFLVSGNTWFRVGYDDVSLEASGTITIGNGTDTYFGFDSQKKLTFLNYNGAQVAAGNITVAGKKYNGVLVRSTNGNTQLVMTDKGLMIGTTGKIGEYRLEFRPQKDILKISKGESELVFEKDNISLAAAKEIYFQYDSKLDLISMVHKNAHISTGNFTIENQNYHGAIISSANRNNQLVVTEDQILLGSQTKSGLYRIGIAPAKEIIEISRGHSVFRLEKDEFIMTTPGDINITSTNGNVNINGKKVNLNE